jgi:hypothetical protein
MPRLSKMPPQIFRIVLLVVGIVGSYCVARYFLTPATFGEYGFYRGAALELLASREPSFAGRGACEECHSEIVKKVADHEHKSLSCESCHGPCKAHAENNDIMPQVLNYGLCVRCHEASPSRPKWHKQVVLKDHYPGSKCTECHIAHSPSETP